MNEATQQGASIHERIERFLSPEPQSEPQEQQEPEYQEPDEPETEEEPVEQEESGREEEEASEDAEREEGEPSESLSLDDLAVVLGIDVNDLDVDDDGKVLLKTKIDGKEGRAKLTDLRKSYQLEGHLNKQNMEVAEMRKQLQQQQEEANRQLSERMQAAESLLTIAQQELNADYNAVNWQALRAEDPAEYSAKWAEFQQRQARINAQYQRLQQERQHTQRQTSQLSEQQLREEGEKLLMAIPEWKKPEVREQETKAIAEYGQKAGFRPEELNNIADHRALVVLRKAMLWDQLQGKKTTVEKQVKKAPPKVAKPSAPKSKQERSAQEQKQLRQRIKQSGGKDSSAIREWLIRNGKV